MRRTLIAFVAMALGGPPATATAAASRPVAQPGATAVVLVLDHGRVHRQLEPVDPASELPALAPSGRVRGPVALAARARRRARPSFAAALDRLFASGAIDRPTRDRYRGSLLAARQSLGRLRGTRRDELGAVLSNLEQIAGAGMLTPSRLPGLVLTLERNRQWWTTGPLLGDGQRVGFPASQLVWQYYAGQGIEIQWLGTFGRANAYFLGGRTHDAELGALLDEAVSLATQRAGGIAWEYDFQFDGGAPPWVSALAQGTGLQALARAAVRFARPEYFVAAHSALGIFATPPPDGVRAAAPAGPHYLIYSFAPGERVLNGFVQSLVGLYDYSGLANSDAGRALFTAGEAEARREVPRYDTGAWSLYDQSSESDLSYHALLRDFLSHLCERLIAHGPAGAPATAGGTPPTAAGAPAPGAPVYCSTADHFTAYMHQPPVVAVAGIGRALAGRAARLRLELSKISDVTLTVRRGSVTVYRMTQRLGHGTRTFPWHPALAGGYRLSADATDLAGNSAATAATVTVAGARGHR